MNSHLQGDKKDPNCREEDKNGMVKNHSKDTNGILSNGVTGPPVSRAGGPVVNGGQTNVTAAAADDDVLKEEPPDFIETHCHWKDCNKEFNTPDELVKVCVHSSVLYFAFSKNDSQLIVDGITVSFLSIVYV